MRITRLLRGTLLTATLGAAAACGDATGPAPISSIDEQAAIARVEPMAAVFDYPLIVSLHKGLAVAHDLFDFHGVYDQTGAADAARSTGGGGESSFEALMLRSLAPTAMILANGITAEARGKTFVYSGGAYVADADATGAPATGMRIVLYAWEPLSESPTLPLTRVGYVEFTPSPNPANATTEVLQARLVRDQGNAELADYTISHATSASGTTVAVAGSISDGATTVRIDVSLTSADARTLTATHLSVSAPSLGVGVELNTTSGETAAEGRGDFTIAYDDHAITTASLGLRGEVRFDGRLYAIITSMPGPADEIINQYSKADGSPLTQQEIDDLSALHGSGLDAVLHWLDVVWF